MITKPQHETFIILGNGTFSSANSTGELLNLVSEEVTDSSEVVVTGSSNSQINDTYTENGTYNGEKAYSSANGWIFYTDEKWCWHTTKTSVLADVSYINSTLTGRYIQLGGDDTFNATADATQAVFSTDSLYATELHSSDWDIGDILLREHSDGYITITAENRSLNFAHNGNLLFDFPVAGDGNAISLFCGLETRLSGSGEDFLYDFDGTHGTWVANDYVHVAGSTKTPNTNTNNVVGISDANTITISGWSVTSPSEASRYTTSEPGTPKIHELWFDTDENNLKIRTQDTLTDDTVYGNTWLRLGYNFPTFQPMDEDDYVDGYKSALASLSGDLRDYPLLSNADVNRSTLNDSATGQVHSGAGWTVDNKIILTGHADSGANGTSAVIDMSDPDNPSYTNLDKTTYNTSNGVVGYDGKTYFLTTNEGGCHYFEIAPTSNSDITSVNATGNNDETWQAITCGPQGDNAIYGLVYNSTSNETYIVKQITQPSASETNASNTLNTQSGQLWTSLSLAYDGNIYALPYTTNGDVLKINTSNDSVSTINIIDAPGVRQTILAPNGMLYGFPDTNTANIVKFDPYTEEAELLDPTGASANDTYYQGFCDPCGKLVVIPDGITGAEVIVFDPTDESVALLSLPDNLSYAYLTTIPGPPGVYYRFGNRGYFVHIIKIYYTLDDYDDYWKYTHFNSR